MNIQLVGQTWDHLGNRHQEMIEVFYKRFLDTYPEYRQHFPASMDHQMKKMVDTMALVARVSEETEIMHPQMMKMGGRHAQYRINAEDLKNFQRVFVEVLSEFCGDHWTSECVDAWNDVFAQHIIPYMSEGLLQ